MKYYTQLKKDEFADLLLPKEQMLLVLVRQIQEEIAQRRREGVSVSQLDMDDVVSPDEKLINQYNKELDGVFSLLKEVEALETRAKRQSDFEVLNTIATLKRRIREMVGENLVSDLMTDTTPTSPSGRKAEGLLEPTAQSQITPFEAPRSGDLFEQWKYDRLLDHKLKQTKYDLLHAKLLGNASPAQKERMFRRELQDALLAYSQGEFALSRLLFDRLLAAYPDRRMDDVLFYAGESSYALNCLDGALDFYRRLIQKYPDSEFRTKALVKLFNVFYIYRDYPKLYKTYEKLQLFRAEMDADTWNTLTYLEAYAEFRNAQFETASRHFLLIDPTHPYYYPALYMSATCRLNLGQGGEAIQLYQKIVKEIDTQRPNPALGQIRNNALLKLGLSYYEKGEHDRAIAVLDRVSINSDYYDLSRMGKAWSAYRAGRPGEALMNVEELFQATTVSNYVYEAQLLAASAKELLGRKDEALTDLKRLYRTAREESPQPESSQIEALTGKVPESRSQSLMKEAERIRRFMKQSGEARQRQNKATESGDRLVMLNRQLSGLDTLEREAQERQDAATVAQIRTLRSEMMTLFGDEEYSSEPRNEIGEDNDLIRQLGVTQYVNYTFELLIQDVRGEKGLSFRDVEEMTDLIGKARESDRYDLALRLEIRRDELEDYQARLNQYEVWLLENIPQSTRMDISQWASFSGYGISNITFSRIKDLETRMTGLSLSARQLDGVIRDKQFAFEQRIQELLSDVAKIEQQMYREEKKRDMLEKEHYFETQYFDKQPKETPAEPVTQPAGK